MHCVINVRIAVDLLVAEGVIWCLTRKVVNVGYFCAEVNCIPVCLSCFMTAIKVVVNSIM